MSQRSKDKELIKAQKEWYKKLAEAGFDDIEIFDKRTLEPITEFTGVKNNSFRQSKAKINSFESTEEYYIKARQHYHNHDFPDDLEKEIWRLHSEGISQRKIATKVGIRRDKIQKLLSKNRQLILSTSSK